MQIGVNTIRMVRVEASEAEWDSLRRLVAEGLSVVDTLTPSMTQVAEALGLRVQAAETGDPIPALEAENDPIPSTALPSPRKSRTRKEREKHGDGPLSV